MHFFLSFLDHTSKALRPLYFLFPGGNNISSISYIAYSLISLKPRPITLSSSPPNLQHEVFLDQKPMPKSFLLLWHPVCTYHTIFIPTHLTFLTSPEQCLSCCLIPIPANPMFCLALQTTVGKWRQYLECKPWRVERNVLKRWAETGCL